MLALLWFLYTAFGLVARAPAPLLSQIVEDLSISYTQMGVILGSWSVVYIPTSLIAGNLLDRWGIRKTIFLGGVIIALSAALRYFANGFISMLLIVCLFGIGGPAISIGCPKAVATFFSGRSRGTAVGIYMTGPWIGALFAVAMTNSFVMPLTGYSWRLAFAYYGVISLVFAFLWWFLFRENRAINCANNSANTRGTTRVFGRLIKMRGVQMIVVIGALGFAVNNGFMYWLPKILETGGMTPSLAGFAASIPIAAGIAGSLAIPLLVPPGFRIRIVALIALLSAASLIVVTLTSGAYMLAGLIVFGFAVFSAMPLLMLILMDSPAVGSRHMGAATGIFYCVAEIGGFGGPFIMGALLDLTGNFFMGSLTLTILNIMIIVLALLLKPAHLG